MKVTLGFIAVLFGIAAIFAFIGDIADGVSLTFKDILSYLLFIGIAVYVVIKFLKTFKQ